MQIRFGSAVHFPRSGIRRRRRWYFQTANESFSMSATVLYSFIKKPRSSKNTGHDKSAVMTKKSIFETRKVEYRMDSGLKEAELA